MKIIKFLRIASLSTIMSLSISVGIAEETSLNENDFDLIQIAEALTLDNHAQLLEELNENQWDDYTDYLTNIGRKLEREIQEYERERCRKENIC